MTNYGVQYKEIKWGRQVNPYKNFKEPKHDKCECGKDKLKKSPQCLECASRSQQKFEVSKEKLKELIDELPFTKIGKMFGVSDNAIRKKAKKYGLICN